MYPACMYGMQNTASSKLHDKYCIFLAAISTDPLQKDEINKKAFEKFRKEHGSVAPTIDNAVPSERFDGECVCVTGIHNSSGVGRSALQVTLTRCALSLSLRYWWQRCRLDHRGTETSGTSPEDLPSQHTRAVGKDCRCRPRTKQERLYEEVQGKCWSRLDSGHVVNKQYLPTAASLVGTPS